MLSFNLAMKLVPHWAMNKWFIILCFLTAGALVVYLYRAQQKIASKRAIMALTAIRFALVLLTFLLLAGITLQWTRTGSSGGTLWLVMDQSGSMAMADQQATDVEKIRWADSLGLLPPDTRPSKLDRRIAQIKALRGDLAFLRTRGELAVEAKDVEKAKNLFVSAATAWHEKLTAIADETEEDPAVKGTDGASVRMLRDAATGMKSALDKVGDKSTREAVASALPWADTLTTLDNTLAALRPLANEVDERFIAENRTTPTCSDALDKVGRMTRAELAIATLPLRSRSGDSASIADLMPRQTTKFISFADEAHITASAEGLDINEVVAPPSKTRRVLTAIGWASLALLVLIGVGAAVSRLVDPRWQATLFRGSIVVAIVAAGVTGWVVWKQSEPTTGSEMAAVEWKPIKFNLEAPVGKSTNLAAPLQYIAEHLGQDEPASVIVWSDGRQNVGGDLVEPARQLAARGVRVFTLALGSEQVAPDAAIDEVDVPDWIYKDDTLKASALLRLDGLQGKPVKVEFRRGDQLLESETKTVTPTADRDTKLVSFSDRPPEPGVFEYSVHVVPDENEAVKENNTQSMRVSVKKDKLAVLMIEDQPRWEHRYLANYLMRDQRVNLQTVLLQPASIAEVERGEPLKASPKNDRIEAQVLPEKKEEWAAFDMIVIGDVPKERLPEEAQRNIVAAVRDRGATVVLIAGLFNMPQRYGGQPLEELLPVDLSGGDWSAEDLNRHLKQGFKPTVAPEGYNSVLSQFTLDEAGNATIYANMPPWYWHSEYTSVRAANVIWTIEDYKKPDPAAAAPAAADENADADTNTLDKIRKKALLATSSVGMGRVMYLASDSTWRLRQVNGMNLHERFWGQVIRWVVNNDLPAGGRFVRFGTNKPKYVAGDSVVVTTRLLGEDFAPLKDQKVKVIARLLPSKDPNTGKPTGEGKVVAETTLKESTEAPGYYRAALSGLPAGSIELSLQGDEVEKLMAKDETVTSKSLQFDIASQLDIENRNINADRATLAGVARAGGGIALEAPYSDVLAAHVPKLNYTTDSVEQFGLFADPNDPNTKKAHWLFLGIFVVLVSAEWIIRKASGLV